MGYPPGGDDDWDYDYEYHQQMSQRFAIGEKMSKSLHNIFGKRGLAFEPKSTSGALLKCGKDKQIFQLRRIEKVDMRR